MTTPNTTTNPEHPIKAAEGCDHATKEHGDAASKNSAACDNKKDGEHGKETHDHGKHAAV